MGFQQGLSGLNAASKSLEAIGNNVANAQTVGFKASQAQFADVYANSLTGAVSNEVGIGVKVSQISQQFSQGALTSSNNPLDIAINGNGFFRMSNNGAVSYGRNGQFELDKNGFIVNASGLHLTGYAVDQSGKISTGAQVDLNISTADVSPKQTAAVNAGLNLDSRNAIPATAVFDMNDPTSYSNATSVAVYDSLGNAHTLQTFFVKTGPVPPALGGGTWDVHAASDGVEIAGSIGTITFKTDGSIDTATTTMPFVVSVPGDNASTTPYSVNVDFTGTTQFGSNFSVNKLTQDGYASGRLSGFNINSDGMLSGRYTNGETAILGQVVLASFANPNGLQPLGNNVWVETAASGVALVSTPGSGSLGVLQSLAVEESNVDLTAELVNMITAQRYYQANAQTIKTEDQILQTLVNLR